MTDREIAELSCPGHEDEVLRRLHEGQDVAVLRCKHCHKELAPMRTLPPTPTVKFRGYR
jgi:hypothetical protein